MTIAMSVVARNEGIALRLLLIVLFSGPLIWPRETWLWTASWRYKHPKVHEPSEAAFFLQQIIAGGWMLACLIALVNLIRTPDPNSPAELQKRKRMEDAVSEVFRDLNRRTIPGLYPTDAEIRDQQDKANRPR